MEVVLLWLDNLDDLVGALRLRAHALLSFSGALALFALTVFAVMHWPWLLRILIQWMRYGNVRQARPFGLRLTTLNIH